MLMFEIFTVTKTMITIYRILQIGNVSTENKIIEKYFVVCILELNLNDINIIYNIYVRTI